MAPAPAPAPVVPASADGLPSVPTQSSSDDSSYQDLKKSRQEAGGNTETSSSTDKDSTNELGDSGTSTPRGDSVRKDIPPLATRTVAYDSDLPPMTDWFAHHLHIRRRRQGDLDDVATQKSVYDTAQAEFFQPRADWENIKSFDPDFRWTWRQEKSAMRKVDFKVLGWVLVMFLSLNIQRSNLTNATADNLLQDIGMTQGDYNIGMTLFRVAFLVAELPSQLISKRLGPDIWIPMQIVAYSAIGASQFALNGRVSFWVTRILMALFQGGFIPDSVLYLSYWYNQHDLPIRMACFFCTNYLGNLVTSFLAIPLLLMRGQLGYEGWRWMFLIEGIMTLIVGIASFFLMPTSPGSTKAPWRPNGYLTDDEAKIVTNRSLRDDPRKGEMHNRQPLTFGLIWSAFTDYHLWPMYLLSLLFNLTSYPLTNYLQIQYRTLGFSTIMANVLAIPQAILSMITLLILTIISEAVNNRAFICSVQNIWYIPGLIGLLAAPVITGWGYFALATAILGGPWSHAIQVAWCSRNSGSVRTRTVSAALYNMSIQVSGIIGANVYQAADSPRYYKANTGLLVVVCFNVLVLYPGIWYFYRKVNQKRAKVWDNMTETEQIEYLRTTKEEGNKRLDFRFAN